MKMSFRAKSRNLRPPVIAKTTGPVAESPILTGRQRFGGAG